jgi:hypothetical protein
VAGTSDHGHEPSRSIKCGNLLTTEEVLASQGQLTIYLFWEWQIRLHLKELYEYAALAEY